MFSISFIPQNGPVCNSSQQQTDRVCVSSSRASGGSSGCSVNSLGPAQGICLSSNCADATNASQVGAFRPVSNATGGSTSTLPAVVSNAPRVAWGLSTGGAEVPRLLRQPQSGVRHSRPEQVHLFAWNLSSVARVSDSFLRQLPTVSARQLRWG